MTTPSKASAKAQSQIGLALVSELMQRDVATLSADATAEEAISTFEEYHISGAPVVDGGGTLIGVLSASDIARREHVSNDRIQTERSEYYLQVARDESRDDAVFDEAPFPQSDYSPEAMAGARVRDWMNPSVVSVEPSASVRDACRIMAGESIHRVLVVEEGKLVGILSSFDVVRAVANS